jgi:hypothetical protein
MAEYLTRVSREIAMVIGVEADSRHEAETAALDWYDGHITDDALDNAETLAEALDGIVEPDVRLEQKTKTWWERIDG